MIGTGRSVDRNPRSVDDGETRFYRGGPVCGHTNHWNEEVHQCTLSRNRNTGTLFDFKEFCPVVILSTFPFGRSPSCLHVMCICYLLSRSYIKILKIFSYYLHHKSVK